MTPRQWTHSRRNAPAQNTDPFDALINESAAAAASGKLLRASRLLRYVEQLRRMRKPRPLPLTIERPPLPPPRPAPPPSSPLPQLPPVHRSPMPRVTDPLAFTPEDEARFAAIRAMRTQQSSDGQD